MYKSDCVFHFLPTHHGCLGYVGWGLARLSLLLSAPPQHVPPWVFSWAGFLCSAWLPSFWRPGGERNGKMRIHSSSCPSSQPGVQSPLTKPSRKEPAVCGKNWRPNLTWVHKTFHLSSHPQPDTPPSMQGDVVSTDPGLFQAQPPCLLRHPSISSFQSCTGISRVLWSPLPFCLPLWIYAFLICLSPSWWGGWDQNRNKWMCSVCICATKSLSLWQYLSRAFYRQETV